MRAGQLLFLNSFYYAVIILSNSAQNTMTTPKKRTRRQERDPANTVTSFSISRKLLAEAKKLADSENRPLSNLIQTMFEREIAARQRQRREKE